MAFSSSKNRHTIRSISLPTRSHPSSLQVEEDLTNFKKWETSISSIPDESTVCSGLTRLDRLYKSVDDLLGMSVITQQALSHHLYRKLVDELSERSMMLLDICGSVRDIVSQVKEHVRDVQSAVRRGKGDFIIENASFLKKLIKDVKKSVADLKHIDDHSTYGSKPLNLDPHLSSVIRVMRDVSEISVSVFGMLLSFFSLSISKLKSANKWSVISKFIHKGTSGSKEQPQTCVEALDCNMEGIENGLECMFRKLIKTRVSLLNILSHD